MTASAALAALGLVLATAALPLHAQDAAAGRDKAAMCIGCHGIAGYQASFPQVHKVPMISGQDAPYIVAALAAYRKGERKHPTMRAVAQSLSDQDMADLAAFYERSARVAALSEPAAPAPAVAELLARGACASCHGANFSKPLAAGYPKIAGQHADYLTVALQAYGIEGQAQVGRGNPIMAAQVRAFKPAELKLLAQYIGSLPGELRTVPQSKFR